MISKYTYGNPIETEAVVKKLPSQEGVPAGWTLDSAAKTLTTVMEKDDIVYGLGETVRGMNKRGWTYTSRATDEPCHTEGKHSLYGVHNFVLIYGKEKTVGYFFDNPGDVFFDIGYTDPDVLQVRFDYMDVDVYEITGESAKAIVKEFRQLIGRSYIPPKWAFGFGQSRWSYMNEDEVREIAAGYKEAGIPLDMIYLDIDYMERYKDFTLNEETFPDFPAFVQEMRQQGIHLIPIIDAGVKQEKGYDVCEEGLAKGYFVKKENGEELVAAVWPGNAYLPDFLNEDARKWFGDHYQFLTDQGIDGFWNDMNEPAIFYTEEALKQIFEDMKQYEGKSLALQDYFDFTGMVAGLHCNPAYYKDFYHEYRGKRYCHQQVHNLYGYFMTRSAGEAFERISPDKRILMFSRSSYPGMHRYGGVWTGDNSSWWSHIKLCISQMPGLNMAGFLYSGADMGGFQDDATEDLLFRWLGISLFTPLMRDHAAMGTRKQELFRFPHREDFSKLVKLRYALLPYIYSEFMKAALGDEMYMAPLSFAYPQDERAHQVEDQLLVGESIMIAPIYTQNARGRYVYLPEEMKLLRMRSAEDYDEEILAAGDHFVACEVNEILVFVRPGHVLPLAAPADNVEQIDYNTLHYITWKAEPESYELYNDDGCSRIIAK